MKNILWFFALIILVLAGDRLGGYLLQQQVDGSQFRYSRMYRGDAKADILLVGNSRGLTFFQPYIEQVTGKSTFNLSYNGMPMDAAKVLVQDYLDQYPQPQCMVVDITTCDRVNDALINGFLAYTDQSMRLDTLIRAKLPTMWWGGKVMHLTRYNSEIFQRALFYKNTSDKDWLLDRVISDQLAADVAKNAYPLDSLETKTGRYLIQQLTEMVKSAQAKGVPVKLVISPYFPAFKVDNLARLKQLVEQATGLTVSDYSQALPDPQLFGDFMHPNKKGAMQYIDLMKKDAVLP